MQLFRPLSGSGRETCSDDSCVVFLHIPKTAGRTLRSTLFLNYPQGLTIHLDILDRPMANEMEAIPSERRAKARLLWGHMPYGVHAHMSRRCEYVTILREPIARAVSTYKYILRSPDHVLHDQIVEGGIELEQYIESGMDGGQTENSQTRQLSGRQFGVLDREALAEAKRHLESFLAVGLTEHFDETFVLLRRALRWRVPVYVTRNVSPPFKASDRAVALLRERNRLDLELYAHAREIFSRQLARQGRSFPVEVSALRALRPLFRAAGERPQLLRKVSRAAIARRATR